MKRVRWGSQHTMPAESRTLVLPPRRPVDPDAINDAINRGWGYETIAYVLNRTVEEIIRAGSQRG